MKEISTHALSPEDLNKYVLQMIDQRVPITEIRRVVQSNMDHYVKPGYVTELSDKEMYEALSRGELVTGKA